jgi:2-polyprenyl-3-methyl-5-hydroxy-6-metoxy-1,4-benzoquinol methylase
MIRHDAADPEGMKTADEAYTERLLRLTNVPWKKLLDVQAPYRWNLRRLKLGRVLDVGCGIGRNLRHLDPRSVGVDHNRTSVEFCQASGMSAYGPAEFQEKFHYGEFDTLLFSHVLEHMTEAEATALTCQYAPFLRNSGRAVLITPQELLFKADSTHVCFVDYKLQQRIVEAAGMRVERRYSFPFPRAFGRLFLYSEFVTVARRIS